MTGHGLCGCCGWWGTATIVVVFQPATTNNVVLIWNNTQTQGAVLWVLAATHTVLGVCCLVGCLCIVRFLTTLIDNCTSGSVNLWTKHLQGVCSRLVKHLQVLIGLFWDPGGLQAMSPRTTAARCRVVPSRSCHVRHPNGQGGPLQHAVEQVLWLTQMHSAGVLVTSCSCWSSRA